MDEKHAYFKGTNNNIYNVEIKKENNNYLIINAYDKKGNEVGYMYIYRHPNNRLYLDVIYCYDKYRNNNIASSLSELADYLLKDYKDHIIRGIYMPGQLSIDKSLCNKKSTSEIDEITRKFYQKNGYQVIDYINYMNNTKKYPMLEENDFYLDDDEPSTIVAKTLQDKEYQYYEDNNIIYHKNIKRSLKK